MKGMLRRVGNGECAHKPVRLAVWAVAVQADAVGHALPFSILRARAQITDF